jgi:large subunit ribosomal protein L7Ae
MSGKSKKTANKKMAVNKVKANVAKPSKRKVVAKPVKKDFNSEHAHLFSKAPRDYRIGRDTLPKGRDLTRFVKWPRYVRIQRQRSVLKRRLKVPPSINQFTNTFDKNQAANLFRFLTHYRPESAQEKASRLKAAAAAAVDGKDVQSSKPKVLKYGLNHVVQLVEEKRARLVVIAHDVDPLELVVWLPALCRKMDVPYVIVKGKARLGHFVYKKTCAALCVTDIKKEHASQLDQLISVARSTFNENSDILRKWGGGVMGHKAQQTARLKEQARLASLQKA